MIAAMMPGTACGRNRAVCANWRALARPESSSSAKTSEPITRIGMNSTM